MLPLVAAERSAAATLREVNRRLAAELPGREFVALALARFDPAGGRLEIANAGLPDPYLLAPGQPPAPLVVPGPRLPLGVRHDIEYHSLALRLAPGERVLLFTDGLAEDDWTALVLERRPAVEEASAAGVAAASFPAGRA